MERKIITIVKSKGQPDEVTVQREGFDEKDAMAELPKPEKDVMAELPKPEAENKKAKPVRKRKSVLRVNPKRAR